MPVDIVAQHGIGDRPALAGSLAIPFAHNRLGIKQVDGKLDEGWPLHAFARGRERFFDGGANVLNSPDLPEKLHVRRGNGALIDVLQSAAPLQQRRRRPSQKYDGGLRELRILQRGYGIGDPGPRGDRHDSRHARQPGDCVGREHGRGLGPGVYDADAMRLAPVRMGEICPPHNVKSAVTPCAERRAATRSPPWAAASSRAAVASSRSAPLTLVTSSVLTISVPRIIIGGIL